MKKRRSIFLCLCVLLLTSTLAFAKAELNFSDRKKKYEVKENKLSSELASLRNPGRWRKITDRRSQEEKNVEIEVVQKLFNIAKEKREGLREGETKEQRKERETGIKNRIISETAEIIRNAKTDELIKTNNLRGAIVNRIALARIIVESKRSIETTKKREKLRLENEIGQLEKKRKGAYNQKRNLNIVTQDLETILKEVRSAQGQLKQAESDLSLVGLTLESEEEQISRRKSFYENSQNVDGEFQTESSAFTSKVEDFKNAKEKVAVIEKVNSQIEGRKSIYEKAKIIANKPTATPSPAARDAAGAGKGDGSSDASGEETHKATPTLARKEIKVEVREGNSIYVRSDKKIKKERIIIEPRIDMSEIRNIEVRGREVFLHEERYKDGKIEIEGYGEFGLLPELKKGNETTLARLYDRVLEGRERKEEGEVDGKGVREEKGRILFEKIGHLCVKEAYELIRKEVRGMSLIPNIVMSVGSDEERKYVYKNIGEKEEEEKNKVWIEGINEIKNYREDEQSIGKYSDNKVGAIVGYGKENMWECI